MVDSIRELGDGARGVAVIDDKTTEASLDAMHEGAFAGSVSVSAIREPPILLPRDSA